MHIIDIVIVIVVTDEYHSHTDVHRCYIDEQDSYINLQHIHKHAPNIYNRCINRRYIYHRYIDIHNRFRCAL